MLRYVSVGEVIDKLLTFPSYRESFSEMDTLTDIDSCIRSIKGGVQLIEKCCLAEVRDGLTNYPADAMSVRMIFYQSKILKPVQYHGANNVLPNEYHDTNKEFILPKNTNSAYFNELLQQLSVRENIINQDYEVSKDELLESVSKNITYIVGVLRTQPICLSNHWYDDTPTCIKFSFQEGYVIIDYKAYAVDEKGYPLIYDEMNYKECLLYYCLYMFNLRREKLQDAIMYKQMYEQYLHRATNYIRRMDYQQMQQFADNWTNLLYNLNDKPYYKN